MIEFAPYLKTGVDNFFSNDFRVIISALLGFPAFILVTAATTGERWSNADVVHFGLQQYCTVNSSFTCCSGFADSFESVPGKKWKNINSSPCNIILVLFYGLGAKRIVLAISNLIYN